jgi:hypothetical protein
MGQKKIRTAICAMRLRNSCAALGLAAGLVLLLAASGPARAEEPDTDSVYSKTFGRLLEGFGLKKAGGDDAINYQERPPLVLPAGRELPPPEKKDTALNPAWPKDPDVTRARLEAKREKERPDRETERRQSEDPKLMNEQALSPGPRPRGVQASNTGPGRSGATDYGEILSPSQLGYKGGMLGKMFQGKDGDVAQFTGEPPRTSLTEPPQGYQTPSPDQPYGIGQAPPTIDNNYETRSDPKR